MNADRKLAKRRERSPCSKSPSSDYVSSQDTVNLRITKIYSILGRDSENILTDFIGLPVQTDVRMRLLHMFNYFELSSMKANPKNLIFVSEKKSIRRYTARTHGTTASGAAPCAVLLISWGNVPRDGQVTQPCVTRSSFSS